MNENPKQPAVLLVGVDVSESMTVKDAIGGQSRIDAVRKTMEKCQPLFDELLTEHGINVVIYKFGPPDFNEATSRWEPTAAADAKRSDYGTYLFRTFERWLSEPRVRGHIVIGDGADNGETYAPLAEAARWGRRGTKIYTFLTGSEAVNPTAKDIAVTTIECEPSPAYIKNTVTVTARVNAYNFPNARVTARVSINDKSEAQQDFTLASEKNELKIPITAPDKPGEIKVKVEVGVEKDGKIVPLPGELSPLNNWSETYLTVNKEGVRVLIVDQLRWEETMLRDALRREKRFNVSEVIRQTDLTATPAERELLKLEDQAYDVVIIGNVSAAHLNKAAPEFLPKLTELVTKRGIGVMFLGGEFAFQDIPEAILPKIGGPVIDDLDKAGNPRRTYPAIPTTHGLEKMFRVAGKPGEAPSAGRVGGTLGPDEQLPHRDRDAAQRVQPARAPEGRSVYRVRLDPRTRPTRSSSKLAATRRATRCSSGRSAHDAKGRWLAFGAFDTYLWRGLGQPKTDDGVQMHERFWKQCVLWLAAPGRGRGRDRGDPEVPPTEGDARADGAHQSEAAQRRRRPDGTAYGTHPPAPAGHSRAEAGR